MAELEVSIWLRQSTGGPVQTHVRAVMAGVTGEVDHLELPETANLKEAVENVRMFVLGVWQSDIGDALTTEPKDA